MKVFTLSGSMPLTKTFSRLENGELFKAPYPHLAHFTSTEHEIDDIKDFYVVVAAAAQNGHCLIKGELNRPLENQSRAGATDALAETSWICLDLDDSPYTDPNTFMSDIGLGDVSYVLQYSASYGLTDSKALGAHIFCLLSEPVKANILKLWLQHLNFHTPTLSQALRLTKSGAALSWPLDITTCQNDKLLYIGDPVLKKVKPAFKFERLQLILKEHGSIDISRLGHISKESLAKRAAELRNAKRAEANLEPIKRRLTSISGQQVQSGVSGIVVTGGPMEARGYVYFNLNGGDSWAYYHPVGDHKYIRNFKGEPWLHTEEVMPEYFAEMEQAKGTPVQRDKIPLALCDLYTATYWNGYLYPEQNTYDLYTSKSITMCEHWMLDHNLDPGDHVPFWKLRFEPKNEVRMNVEERFINLWKPSKYHYMDVLAENGPETWPTIHYVIDHLCGNDPVAVEYVLNWVACLYQHRVKIGVALVFQGNQGTGKGTFINQIIKPTLGETHVHIKRQSEMIEKFNLFLRDSLLVWIDEAEISSLKDSGTVVSDLKTYITEPTTTIRAMRTDAVEVPSSANFILASNKRNAAVIDETDRRYSIITRQENPLVTTDEMHKVLIPAERHAFYSYMMTREASLDIARKPLNNAAKQEMKEMSSNSIELLSTALLKGDLQYLYDQMPDDHVADGVSAHSLKASDYRDLIHQFLAEVASGNKQISITRDELFIIFEYCVGNMPQTPTRFTQLLGHKGIRVQAINVKGKTKRGIVVNFTMDNAAELLPQPQPKLRAVK